MGIHDLGDRLYLWAAASICSRSAGSCGRRYDRPTKPARPRVDLTAAALNELLNNTLDPGYRAAANAVDGAGGGAGRRSGPAVC